MNLAERINLWATRVRAAGRVAVLSRLLILVSGGLALTIAGLQPWDQVDLVLYAGIAALVVTIALPDSAAPFAFLVAVAGGWLMRGPSEPGWQVAAVAMALVAFHLATAYAAQLPAYVRATGTTARRWLLPATVALLLAPAVAAMSALVRNAELSGSLALTITALALATTAYYLPTQDTRACGGRRRGGRWCRQGRGTWWRTPG
ncbi:hypothetical protein [Kribbella deserti]|uniref:Uncharacterized protein n=1 Tax=Kribbella deserti TaxID=1926257 RepID=A0ABV6QRY7_9ACTN